MLNTKHIVALFQREGFEIIDEDAAGFAWLQREQEDTIEQVSVYPEPWFRIDGPDAYAYMLIRVIVKQRKEGTQWTDAWWIHRVGVDEKLAVRDVQRVIEALTMQLKEMVRSSGARSMVEDIVLATEFAPEAPALLRGYSKGHVIRVWSSGKVEVDGREIGKISHNLWKRLYDEACYSELQALHEEICGQSPSDE